MLLIYIIIKRHIQLGPFFDRTGAAMSKYLYRVNHKILLFAELNIWTACLHHLYLVGDRVFATL